MLTRFFFAVAAMAFVVALSNYLVQFPVDAAIGSYQLADLLTWGAFTYPVAFLVNDLVEFGRLNSGRWQQQCACQQHGSHKCCYCSVCFLRGHATARCAN